MILSSLTLTPIPTPISSQVLASNQLTMAATAAIPSFAVLAVGFYAMKRFFTRSPPNKGETTLNLRLSLTEVERSLREVYV